MKKSLLIGLVMFAAGFGSGRTSRATGTTIPVTANAIDPTDYARVWQVIKSKHIDKDITDAQLFYGAVEGLARGTKDPYTVFYTPQEAKRFKEHTQGSFFGIGAVLEQDRDGNIMVRPMEGSPAAKAGMRTGDLIVSVDGKRIEEIGKVDDVVDKIHGEEGKPVKITVYRPDLKKKIDLVIVRGKIIADGEAKLKIIEVGKKKFLVIPFKEFSPESAKFFDKAVDEAKKSRVDGVVLDLRNDPGGRVDIAGHVVCSWVNNKPFVIFEDRNSRQQPLSCELLSPMPFSNMPTVVLINKYSASASEITAAALQDAGKARIMGETSFGKGCAQDVLEFPDGSMLKLTTQIWKTPNNRPINKIGVKPDEAVKALVDTGGEDDVPEAAPSDPKKSKKEPKDAQLDRAIEFLTTGH